VVSAPLREGPAAPAPELGADIARADAELRERVQRALLDTPSLSYTAQHVHVAVDQRHVTLRGEVRNAYERGEIELIVRALPGVKTLDNQVALINPPTEPRRR
jgi:osmotically-inducible protein OsmY